MKFLHYIKEKCLYKVKNFICDFELAIIAAIKNLFVGVKINGCIFHYSQSLFRKIQKCGLQKKCMNLQIYKNAFRMFLNLAFFPIYEIDQAYKHIIEQLKKLHVYDEFEEFVAYFENTYIGAKKVTKEHCNSPIYHVDFWNSYDRIIYKLPRTINGLESWHRTLNLRMFRPHPNLARFLTVLIDEVELIRLDFLQKKFGNGNFEHKQLAYEHKLFLAASNSFLYKKEDYFKVLCNIARWKKNSEESEFKFK